MKPLKLINPDREVTRQQIAMAEIEQKWREYRGPNGAEWRPYEGPTTPWSASVSETLDRGRYVVNLQENIPVVRRILRWLWRLK